MSKSPSSIVSLSCNGRLSAPAILLAKVLFPLAGRPETTTNGEADTPDALGNRAAEGNPYRHNAQ
jgi:hypothetical protein